MRILFLFTLLVFLWNHSYGQKLTGVGGELSVVGFKPNVRMWISRTAGFEVFGGVAAEMADFKPNDFEGGIKYLNNFMYNRTDRTYFGLMGKWKRVSLEGSEIKIGGDQMTTSLPVVGILIGKEWLNKRQKIKGFAVELGYQYGVKNYEVQINPGASFKKTYEEFPLILNLRYSFYKKKK